MATNIEIEAKALITRDEYFKVVEHFKADKLKKITQTNFYIDTDEMELRKIRVGLRIRQSDDFILTLKAPLAEGLLEQNENITWKQYEDFKETGTFPEGKVKEFLKMLRINPDTLKILTQLTTERIYIPDVYEDGTFSIDKNTYNDIVDYELELEGNSLNKCKEKLKSICNECQIEFKDNIQSKHNRAFSTMKK